MPEPYPHAFARNLRILNSSELHHLVQAALDAGSIPLGEGFKSLLRTTFNMEVPDDVFAGIGYRIDWLQAALKMTFEPAADHVYERRGELNQAGQDTVDVLVAWDEPEAAHVIMLLTRATSQAANRQFKSRIKQINAVFGGEGDRWAGVYPHIGIVSIREPSQSIAREMPSWALKDGAPIWVRASTRSPFLQVTRCDDVGTPTASGDYWTLRQV